MVSGFLSVGSGGLAICSRDTLISRVNNMVLGFWVLLGNLPSKLWEDMYRMIYYALTIARLRWGNLVVRVSPVEYLESGDCLGWWWCGICVSM